MPRNQTRRNYLERLAAILRAAPRGRTEYEREETAAELRRVLAELEALAPLTRPARHASMFMHGGNNDMGRRRGQRNGYLYKKGPSWILRWREDVRTPDGGIARVQIAQAIAPVTDPATGRKVTRPEAQRIAWEDVLSKLDKATIRPQSLMTVAEFCRARFEPDHVAKLKAAGKAHYGTSGDRRTGEPARGQLKAVIESIGDLTLRQVRTEHVQAAVDARLKTVSVQTAVHLRNAISAVFAHAIALGYYHGDHNPAEHVRMPAMVRKEPRALTADQAAALLDRLREENEAPVYEMVLIALTASLNVAELLALRWRRLNLTADSVTVEGEALPPFALRVAENNYRGQIGTTKTPRRRRVVPLAPPVVAALTAWSAITRWKQPEDFVFAGPRSARPLNENNLRNRILAPAGKAIGLTWPLSWHVLRHTHATLAEQLDFPLSERQANMGHASGQMTLHYTHAEIERRRGHLAQLATLLIKERQS